MAFTPVATDLGSVYENTNFSHAISYIDDILLTPLPVRITKMETNPNTIITVSDNIPTTTTTSFTFTSVASVSGYYFDSFSNTITYRTIDDNFVVVSKFSQIDLSKIYGIISYKASLATSKVFTYKAEAIDPTTLSVVATQIYTKTALNNYSTGASSLLTYLGYNK